MSDSDIQWKTPTGPANADPDPDGGLWLFLLGFDVFAVLVTFHLYGLFNSVLVALVVMTGIGCAGLRKMGRLGNVFVFGLHTFFMVQLGAILGASNIGVETGPFALSFGWWVALAIGAVMIHFRGYMFGTGTGTYVDADEVIDEIKRRR